MTDERLYVAGPMSGIEQFNYPAFNAAAADLRQRGYEVLNPAENSISATDLADPNRAWQMFMRISVAQIASAHGIACLDGWHQSRGASFEIFIATQLGLVIMPVADWLRASMRSLGPVGVVEGDSQQ